jgi:hypothetical protein
VTPGPPEDEGALIPASQSGDPGAQDALVRRYQDRVYGFAMRMCRNVEDAKDILQETFLGMVRALPDFRGESRFTTWLYRSLRPPLRRQVIPSGQSPAARAGQRGSGPRVTCTKAPGLIHRANAAWTSAAVRSR